ncbi:MAG TPA: PEP-CTERM sorting domain-containing protein [Myxococcota bacterium]|jgi:hypothetical protein
MLSAAALLAFGVTGSASAAPLHWDGTLTLELGTLPSIPAVGSGVATVNDSGAIGHLGNLRLKASRGGISNKNVFVPVTDAAAAPIVGILITADLGTGTLGPISGGAQSSPLTKNILPVAGLAKVCLFSTACGTALPLALTQHTTATGTKGVGIGGIVTIGGTSPIRISIEAAPWTIKTKTSIDQITTPVGGTVKKFVNRTEKGFAHGPSSNTSSTANPSGVVQLITPMQVVTNLTNGSNQKIALFGFLTIHFVPEPGMLLLLGSGVAGLVLLGRHRMRK